MTVRWIAGGMLVATLAVAGCANPGADAPAPKPTTSSKAVPLRQTLAPDQQRFERIRGMLYTNNCTSNACVQTYFACMDGLLTGDPCDFYRAHPPPE
ncbi:hypothetical protein [Nocardia camponoti]|uniref:Lipoprotein n=1 Tax=Nocardia camponoti TaxID=1616106 RepID=A0A917QIH7_9NOCA|nr:hypothetical protein [Nocardia camponoti]GGK52227.1 hypothetical protein GCM10011591_24960 [Nocardia camponoti]